LNLVGVFGVDVRILLYVQVQLLVEDTILRFVGEVWVFFLVLVVWICVGGVSLIMMIIDLEVLMEEGICEEMVELKGKVE